MNAKEAAKKFIAEEFEDCLVAFLAGSVVRGEETKTSDLDIVIITEDSKAPFRNSYYKYSWPIEAFVHTMDSYKKFFKSDFDRRRPSLPQMCREGLVIKDTDNLSVKIKEDADKLLDKGVTPYTDKQLEDKRYMITDLLDDLIGCEDIAQQIFIVNKITELLSNLILVTNGQWEAQGKWIPKRLKALDTEIYEGLMEALQEFYKREDKQLFIDFVENQLDKVGGRLFEGYFRG